MTEKTPHSLFDSLSLFEQLIIKKYLKQGDGTYHQTIGKSTLNITVENGVLVDLEVTRSSTQQTISPDQSRLSQVLAEEHRTDLLFKDFPFKNEADTDKSHQNALLNWMIEAFV